MRILFLLLLYLAIDLNAYSQDRYYMADSYIFYNTYSNAQYTSDNPQVERGKFIIQIQLNEFSGYGKIVVRNETANTTVTHELNGNLKELYNAETNLNNKIFAGKLILYGLSQLETVNLVFDGSTNKLVSIIVSSVEHQSKGHYIGLQPIEDLLNSTGTGVIVSKEGYIITNYHVVKKSKSILISGIPNSNKKLDAKLISFDEEKDIALLKVNQKISDVVYTLDSAKSDVGERIFVLGFPMIDLLGSEIKVTDGIISSVTGFSNDPRYYQVSASVQPGNSGGPLFDSQGDLIGIITAKFTQGENVSYALKSKIVFDFLKRNNVQLPNSPQTKSESSLVEKIKKLKPNVISIEAIRQ